VHEERARGARLREALRSAPDVDCIFCRIASGALPAERLYEDELVLAIRDIRPQAPVHALVLPRKHVASLWELAERELAGALLSAAAEVARGAGLERGWRLIANTREHGGQEVAHLHLHVLGGRPLGPMLVRPSSS
jgi:histidine triad (HIT) family protein